ncbi:MAG: glycosyltransferase family 2 protein, partial [Pseudomonadota bacterium]
MKLIIQIPCFNEAETLPETVADLPREVEGFDSVEWLVIDDGSTDGTAEIAREAGVDHVVSLPHNQGLARAYITGLEAAMRLGADVIVNTDADNQYDARGVPALTAPILAGEAQIVIGARPIEEIAHFSYGKRVMQRVGSWVVSLAAGIEVEDAPSGFRAMHRNAAMQLYVFNRYTYTLETIIQAGRLSIPIVSVPVGVNPPTRPSRLVRSSLDYALRSIITIIRVFVLYRPFRSFAAMSLIVALPGLYAFARFFIFYLMGDGGGRIQSLVVGGAFLVSAIIVFIGG